MERVAIFGVWFILAVSFGSLLFFIFLINPKYLSFSGFLVFYAAVFGFLWSTVLLLWNYLRKKRGGRNSGMSGASRQAIFLALCAVIVLFFSQMNVLSLYVLVPFGALFVFTQYILIKRG